MISKKQILFKKYILSILYSEERTSSTHALTMYRHNTIVDGKEVKVGKLLTIHKRLVIDIWDTAGQESFNELHPSYYFRAHACILVFDASRKVTYANLKNWYKEMRNHCPHIPCLVIANKIDIDERAT
jgi:Rab-like protein 2